MRTIQQIKDVLAKKGYVFFDKGFYNLNIIAVRENDVFDNTFSDTLYVIWNEPNQPEKMLQLPWTTLAGVYGHGGEKDPLKAWETGTPDDGVAIILEGQYRGAFELVLVGPYFPFLEYFKQVKSLKYFRDNDKNGVVTRGKIVEGNFSTHLHPMSAAGTDGLYVSAPGWNPWSQGCNGCPDLQFKKLLRLGKLAANLYGNIFTYTLIHAKDFFQK